MGLEDRMKVSFTSDFLLYPCLLYTKLPYCTSHFVFPVFIGYRILYFRFTRCPSWSCSRKVRCYSRRSSALWCSCRSSFPASTEYVSLSLSPAAEAGFFLPLQPFFWATGFTLKCRSTIFWYPKRMNNIPNSLNNILLSWKNIFIFCNG